MGKYYSWVNTAVAILRLYNGDQPFAAFLKSFFSGNKKYGSKDRKQISHLCYSYFRLGKIFAPVSGNDEWLRYQILAGLFLTSRQPSEILAALKPEWEQKVTGTTNEKISLLQSEAIDTFPPVTQIFPWKDALSEGIDDVAFSTSFLQQPDVFIRVRPGFEDATRHQLEWSSLEHRQLLNNCFALPGQVKLEELFHINRQVVVQDYSSQQVGQLLQMIPAQQGLKVWDCCAASGGKSILAKDILGAVELTVSDIRESILSNCRKRLLEAGVPIKNSFTADLTRAAPIPLKDRFDLIICDAPCSGSGTWGRTPEQLYYFEEQKIEEFQQLQQQIVQNIIPYIQKGGYLLYITCSVFKMENEEVVRCISRLGPECVQMQVFKGWPQKADTMFAALFRNP